MEETFKALTVWLASGTEAEGNPYRTVTSTEERIACDAIVNTAPLPALIALLGDAASPEARAAAKVLRFRALTIVGLRVKRPKALPAQSIYFTNKTFNRLSETRNYGGSDICAPDETVLLCDITCDVGDKICRSVHDRLGRARRLGLVRRHKRGSCLSSPERQVFATAPPKWFSLVAGKRREF